MNWLVTRRLGGCVACKLKVKGLDFVRATDASSTLSGLRRKMDGMVTRGEGVCLAPSLRPEGKRITPRGVGGHPSHSGAVEVEDSFCKVHKYADAIYRGAIVSTSDGALHPDGWFSGSYKPTRQNEGDNQKKGYVTHGSHLWRVLTLIPSARQANVKREQGGAAREHAGAPPFGTERG